MPAPKFNIDKRKAHLSTLIFDGQISKSDALSELEKPIYPNNNLLEQDYNFVLKKLDFKKEEFEKLMATPRKEHSHYKVDKKNFWAQYPILKPFAPIWRKIKRK